MAYESNESGRDQIYVRPFPEVGLGQVLVSNDGGFYPKWSPNGRELFYIEDGAPARLMSVTVEDAVGGTFTYGSRRAVMPWPYVIVEPGRTYDVSVDGQRFLAVKAVSDEATDVIFDATGKIYVVTNGFEELRQHVRN